MNASLHHVLDLVIKGVLTELPAQLVTAALAAGAAAWLRTRKRSQTRSEKTEQ